MQHLVSALTERNRKSGFLYLLRIAFSIYGVLFVSLKMGVSGTDEMADKIFSNDLFFRSGIISRLAGTIATLFLAFSLYRLLHNVNRYQAKLMFTILVISIPFQFVAEVFNITASMISRGELLRSLDGMHRHDLIVLFLNVYNVTVSITQCCWALWLFPFGALIYHSHILPRSLGIVVWLGAIGYLIDYLTFLLFPIQRSVTVFALLLGFLCEIIAMIGLLMPQIKGLPPANVRAA